MVKRRAVPLWFNKVMKLDLRTPLLHRVVSRNTNVTYTGRKMGKVYTILVSYTQHRNAITLFTNCIWWKSLIDNMPVILRLRGEEAKVTMDFATTV